MGVELKTKLPILKGFIESGCLVVWCPYCKRWHCHGAGGSDGGQGSRVAHCALGGFNGSEYFAGIFTKADVLRIAQFGKRKGWL